MNASDGDVEMDTAGIGGKRFAAEKDGSAWGVQHPHHNVPASEALGTDWNRLEPRSNKPPLPCQRSLDGFLGWIQDHGFVGQVDYPRLSALHFEYCLLAEVAPTPKTQLRRALEAAGCRRAIRDITKRGRRNKVVTYDIPSAVMRWAA